VLKRERAVATYEDLGAYKYLLKVALDGGVRDPTVDAVAKLLDYDRQRGSSLIATLEEFLSRRGNISATSEALYVHPNTLRQRLRRIAELSGLDLRRDDWLTVEIAVKMVKLKAALGTANSDT
jgi:DNA-binding PucR family transcriptional regulator